MCYVMLRGSLRQGGPVVKGASEPLQSKVMVGVFLCGGAGFESGDAWSSNVYSYICTYLNAKEIHVRPCGGATATKPWVALALAGGAAKGTFSATTTPTRTHQAEAATSPTSHVSQQVVSASSAGQGACEAYAREVPKFRLRLHVQTLQFCQFPVL